MRDIYDPPPAPEQDFNPASPDPLIFTRDDFICLAGLCTLLTAVSFTAWRTEPALALATAAAGSLVILESWFTALGVSTPGRAAPTQGEVDNLSGRARTLADRLGRGRERDAVAFLGIRPRRLTAPVSPPRRTSGFPAGRGAGVRREGLS